MKGFVSEVRNIAELTWRSKMSSPRTGILSLIRFDLGQNWDV